jgi:hypothetical protein
MNVYKLTLATNSGAHSESTTPSLVEADNSKTFSVSVQLDTTRHFDPILKQEGWLPVWRLLLFVCAHYVVYVKWILDIGESGCGGITLACGRNIDGALPRNPPT